MRGTGVQSEVWRCGGKCVSKWLTKCVYMMPGTSDKETDKQIDSWVGQASSREKEEQEEQEQEQEKENPHHPYSNNQKKQKRT